MLRHFKMELKRQQERENQLFGGRQESRSPHPSSNLLQQVTHQHHPNQSAGPPQPRPLASADVQAIDLKRKSKGQQQRAAEGQANELRAKRVRGRRSSKPAMEKRRRARINECLDILKSYVLNDTGNLNRLGIDLSAGAENRLDEDSIAREILKSSGLIHRHRGRKNPNKLEKADILELTVDYVRRLHEQRDELLVTAVLAPQHQNRCHQQLSVPARQHQVQQEPRILCSTSGDQAVPAHLSEPLTLDLSPKSRVTSTTPPTLQAYRPPPNTPLTPPSSDGQTINSAAYHQSQVSQMQLLSQVLDGRYKLHEYVSFPANGGQGN